MIQDLLQFIQQFFAFFIWWVIIQPWEQGIRVRMGKNRKLLLPGIHWKIPYADAIYRQTTRLRFSSFGPQTVTTKDGHAITVAGIVGFVIRDLDRLYDTLQHPNDSVSSLAMGAVAEYVASHDLDHCKPDEIAAACRPLVRLRKYGLSVPKFSITSYARVRTLRLIMDKHPEMWGDNMSMSRSEREAY